MDSKAEDFVKLETVYYKCYAFISNNATGREKTYSGILIRSNKSKNYSTFINGITSSKEIHLQISIIDFVEMLKEDSVDLKDIQQLINVYNLIN